MSEYLTCKEIIDFLDDYVEGRQALAVRAEFERHLGVCPPCVDYLRTYRDTINLARCSGAEGADAIEAPTELVKAIMSALKPGTRT